jgi:VanZ family protein
MSNNLRGWIRLLYIWLPAFVGIGIIALESTVMMGSAETSGPLRKIFETLFGAVPDARWDLIHHYIRKTGHFTGYGIIGVFFFRAWYLSMPLREKWSRVFRACIYALSCTFVLASSDEYHQSLIPGRTSSPFDVLIDMSGALVLQLVVIALIWIFSRTPKKPDWRNTSVVTARQ